MMLKDGTELPFGDLPLEQIHTEVAADGATRGTVDLTPPADKFRHRFPLHVHTVLGARKAWRITAVDQFVH